MGKLGFTPIQEQIFTEFSKEDISKQFYFTGGTALSVFYLHHRQSEDLDFFTEKDFDSNQIIKFVNRISRQIKIPFRFTQKGDVRIIEFVKKDKLIIKIDFNYYPYKRVETGKLYNNLAIDSIRDIAGNKLLTVNQRTDVKDFVDLYFLLKKFTLWDLIYVVGAKFGMEFDMVLIASDFLKVEEFDFLPKMLIPLEIKDLILFFRNQAREIGKRITI